MRQSIISKENWTCAFALRQRTIIVNYMCNHKIISFTFRPLIIRSSFCFINTHLIVIINRSNKCNESVLRQSRQSRNCVNTFIFDTEFECGSADSAFRSSLFWSTHINSLSECFAHSLEPRPSRFVLLLFVLCFDVRKKALKSSN